MAVTAQTDKGIDNRAIDTLDLKKYVGLWYEIARFDHPFERGLVGVTTEYIIKHGGNIEVIGRGYQDSLRGEKKEIVGHVHIPDTTRPGVLRVTFFLIFNTDYHILEVEKDYSAALIGSSECDHLLDREPYPDSPAPEIKRFNATGTTKRLRHDHPDIRPTRAKTNSERVNRTLSYFPYF